MFDSSKFLPKPTHYTNWILRPENQHLGHDEWPDIAETAHNVFDKQKHNITDDQRRNISAYTSSVIGTPLNQKLIDNHKQNVPLDPESHFFKRHQHIQTAIRNNKLTHDVKVFSGIGFNPHDLMDDKKLIHLPAYTSCSLSKDRAKQFAFRPSSQYSGIDKHMMSFNLKSGDPAMYISKYSDLPGEKEMLLGHGITIQHHSIDSYTTNKPDVMFHVHHVSIVDRGSYK